MSPWLLVVATLVMVVGASVQGSVGFGVNLVAAPVLILIDPQFVPSPIIMAALVLNVLVVRRERGPQHWELMQWPIVGSIPGSIAGAAVVATFAKEGLTVVFGVLILVAVGLSISGLHPRRTPVTLTAAGILAGFSGTAVGIGGPPMALLFQRSSGPEIRGALSRFFLIGGFVSLGLLLVFGQLHLDDLRLAALLLPGTLVGYATSGLLARHVEAQHVRVAVLALSSAAAIIAIARAW